MNKKAGGEPGLAFPAARLGSLRRDKGPVTIKLERLCKCVVDAVVTETELTKAFDPPAFFGDAYFATKFIAAPALSTA